MGALYKLDDHLGKNLRITLKLGTGVADTADALSTEETALGCRSQYPSKLGQEIALDFCYSFSLLPSTCGQI